MYMMVISMEIKLFEHNEKAFNKLKEFLRNNILASIDHATGTGKSFITLKYLYENKDKRILYLTPTYAIFDQLFDVHMKKLGIDKKEFKRFDNIIYPNILKKSMNDLAEDYDIIVWDEYHRCGAKKWGKKIKELKQIIVEKYPNKRIIGLTATNIRYLDNERDMNAELFDCNCVSRLTLDESILKGLLPSPTYINTYSSCDIKLDNLKKSLKGFDVNTNKLQTELISDEELESAKLYLKTKILDNTETSNGKNSLLSKSKYTEYGISFPNLLLSEIDKVTKEDIKAAANYIFQNPSLTSIVASKKTLDHFKTTVN